MIDGLIPGTNYKIYILAVNGIGQSEPSNELIVSTKASQDATVPEAPYGLSASDIK